MTVYTLFGLIGITLIITISKLTSPFRRYLNNKSNIVVKKIGELLNCSMCTGFWIGFVYSLMFEDCKFPLHFVTGGLVSVCSYIVDTVTKYYESLID